MAQRPFKSGPIKPFAELNDEIFFVRQIAAKEEIAEQGNQRERKEERTDESGGDGPGHGREDAAFVALQREDRNMGGDDDEHRKECWPAHFASRFEDGG